MEDRYKHRINGQSVLQGDLNTISEAAALADDRVFAELFRMPPFDGSSTRKAILPYAVEGSGNEQLVAPNGATGTVRVNPFRAFAGSRTAVGTDAKENWRDIRSTIVVGATTLAQTVSFAAASPGLSRWDLVYAVVSVDVDGPSVTRKVKDPTSKVVAAASVAVVERTSVAIGVVTGTPALKPTMPAAPSDSGSNFYIPLAYVCIPGTYSPTFILEAYKIVHVAPVLALARSTGGASVRVADQQYTPGGPVLNTDAQGELSENGGVYPQAYLPSTMGGSETLLVALDLWSLNQAFHSHTNGTVIDSRDWRGRLCFWSAVFGFQSEDEQAPWLPALGPLTSIAFDGRQQFTTTPMDHEQTRVVIGAGQTLTRNFEGLNAGELTPRQSLVALLSESNTMLWGSIAVYCDHDDGGKLKLYKPTGNPNPRALVFLKLDFTAPFGSRAG